MKQILKFQNTMGTNIQINWDDADELRDNTISK